MSLLSDLLSKVSDIGRSLRTPSSMLNLSLAEECEAMFSKKGEATTLAHAAQILNSYAQLDDNERKLQFFKDIQARFGIDTTALEKAIEAWQKDQTETAARMLHFASEPRSQDLIRRLNQAPNGTSSLVKMRTDLLKFMKIEADLRALDKDFSHLFNSWFNRGFLELQRIDWNTPAAILEKIIAYEAVHEINGWDDLRQRVGAPDRRLYGYFHPALGNEPLIFVEVALLKEVPGAIGPILSDDRDPIQAEEATTAVFYSISNCQTGLRGISFGNFLIKQVVEDLRHEFEKLDTFITLSPVPGFRKWAEKAHLEMSDNLSGKDNETLGILTACQNDTEVMDVLPNLDHMPELLARYLISSKGKDGGAVDPVARFHLGNGARLENLHMMGDISKRGLKNSWGCMVNYQYRIKDIEKNHETYVNNGEVIAAPHVAGLLK
ncbi:malonyl-CoA decarboxylase [Curvivirga aplysinae]|uniref:malonyl-CoA decarboxylase n=1 Tax=Curvivirga aplysinae TaxID=2529852 RepID=UPI0012BC8D3C|nr:malonyl-CoA decarboxylase [Curvivirga aplysinae]MTI10993.1 MCD, Malonyl-CoA decarboxylase MCD [Curvivirga aplysinae]